MDAQPNTTGSNTTRSDAVFASDKQMRVTRYGVIERLADPYLTDHDRWVLRQFARFLSGKAPDPDPRAIRPRPVRPTYSRVRRSL